MSEEPSALFLLKHILGGIQRGSAQDTWPDKPGQVKVIQVEDTCALTTACIGRIDHKLLALVKV